jgi:predicted metalloprotease
VRRCGGQRRERDNRVVEARRRSRLGGGSDGTMAGAGATGTVVVVVIVVVGLAVDSVTAPGVIFSAKLRKRDLSEPVILVR